MKGEHHALERWAPWALGVSALALGLSVWGWYPPGIWHDDGVYVLLGKAMAEGHGLRYVGVTGDFLAPKFPPLFPLLLGLLWSMAPSFPGNLILLSSANLVFTAVAAGVFMGYGVKVLRVPLPWVAGAGVLAWMSPALWRLAMVPLSEPLFILLVLMALWAGGRLEKGGGWRAMVLFLLLATAAFLTRTIGITLLLGGAGALLLRGRRRDGILVLLFGGLLASPWMVWSRLAAGAIPDPLLDTLGPYGGWLFQEIARSPGHYLSFLPANGAHLLGRMLSLFLPGVSGGPLWMGLLLLPILALGLWNLGRRSLLLPLTVALYLAALLLWPFQDVRLLVPMLPLLILGLVVGFRVLFCSGVLPLGNRIPLAMLAMSWVAAFMGLSAVRLAAGWPREAYEVRSEALVQAVRAVQEKTPEHAVVGAPELWAGIHLYTGRRVAPSARFRPLSTRGPSWGRPEEQYRLWREAELTHILVEHGGKIHGEALDRVDAICPPGTVQLLDMNAGQFLVALNWDEECQHRLMGNTPRPVSSSRDPWARGFRNSGPRNSGS